MLLVEKKRESSNGSDAGHHQFWFVSERRVKDGNGGCSPEQENERVQSPVLELQGGHRLRSELRRAAVSRARETKSASPARPEFNRREQREQRFSFLSP